MTLIAFLVPLLAWGGRTAHHPGRAPETSTEVQAGSTPGLAEWPPCDMPGWFPPDFQLKDHTLFSYDGLYYIASIYAGSDGVEDRFAYAVSADLCAWTHLGGILEQRPVGDWDEYRIWAPHVYEEAGVYYMYYTGVTRAFAQSIMLATSTDPADPGSWQRQGVILQPAHPGHVWGGFDTWSDCRDPMVVKQGEQYYLYYTGLDTDGGIVGMATAPAPWGPWTDWGSVLTTPRCMPESPMVTVHDGVYYLFYNCSSPTAAGERFRYGPTLAGPWSPDRPLTPGWAHEVWTGQDGNLYTSFLTDYTITIRRLTWNPRFSPPHPFVGATIHLAMLPFVAR